MKAVRVGRLAQAEINRALRSSRRRTAFDQRIRAVVSMIAANPRIGGVASRRGERIVPVGLRFPYSVVYYDEPAYIGVIAFAHQKRRFGYWSRRRP